MYLNKLKNKETIMNFRLIKATLAVGVSCLIVSGGVASAHAAGTVEDDSFDVLAGQTYPYIRVLDNDDPSVTEILSTTDPVHGTLEKGTDNIFAYTPAEGYSGPDSFTYTAAAPDGTPGTATVDIRVLPTAVTDSLSVAKDQSTPLDVLANDVGVDLSLVSIPTPPEHGTAVIDDGMIVYTPQPGFTGFDYLQYQIQGPSDDYVGAYYGVTWISVEGELFVHDFVDFYSPDNDVWVNNNIDGLPPFTVSGLTQPAHGTAALFVQSDSVTFTSEGFTVVYTPEKGFTGVDTFTYKVVDVRGQTATGTVAIIVNSNGAEADFFTVDGGTATALDVLANDIDGGSLPGLELSGLDSAPEHGTAVIHDNKVVYTPDNGFTGNDSFVYTLTYRGYLFNGLVAVQVLGTPFPTGGTAVHGASSLAPVLIVVGLSVIAAGCAILTNLARRKRSSL